MATAADSARERRPVAGRCGLPRDRGTCDGYHVLDPESLKSDGMIRFECSVEDCDGATIHRREPTIERLDEEGFDELVAAARGGER